MGAAGEDDQPGLMLQLVRIEDELPDGFEALRAEGEAEGHRHMTRLAVEVGETPECARHIAEGAVMRLICGEQCFEAYRAYLWAHAHPLVYAAE